MRTVALIFQIIWPHSKQFASSHGRFEVKRPTFVRGSHVHALFTTFDTGPNCDGRTVCGSIYRTHFWNLVKDFLLVFSGSNKQAES